MLRNFGRAGRLLEQEAPAHTAGEVPLRDRTVLAVLRAQLALTTGDVESAFALTVEGLAAAERDGLRQCHSPGQALLATAALRKVDIAAAMTHVTRIGEDAMLGRSLYVPGQCAWVTALAYRATHDIEGALRLTRELVEPGPVSRELLLAQPGAAPWLARFALGVGEPALAHRALTTVVTLAARNPFFPTVTAAALHTRGVVEAGVDDLRRAADAHADPWARASALEDIGTLLAASRTQRAHAADVLGEAGAAYLASGSLYDYMRTTSRIRELGGINGTNPAPPVREEQHPEFSQLTRSEQAVAKLVAQGMTNVQVARVLSLSRHTVAFHLRKIFRKLDVSSRVELAHMWGNRGA
ncbi:helix-turn-helix transcriptional regulator [Streptomyces capitiformicae]|uniref:Helix-turn-helix transcriptional regulator n=1 Tax=Streptomyces capitiformicae TaxID=2014920 RepID=A0A919GJY5_9ACTN|nr:LuxR C-terminal-related transcriptional regulator [Streptomyces capitiformicae]GHH85877.1 helix-turn-helix transcriptional regulator [Streptomyces capitiformicae]